MTAMVKWKGAEAAFWAIALACIGYLFFVAHEARVVAQRAEQLPAEHAADASAVHGAIVNGEIIGNVEIPALAISAAVLQGDDPASLLKGLGHIQGTAQPGGLGTVGLAGHRDTFLRPLRHVLPGMLIKASTRSGVFEYIVDSTEIVKPEAVEVLDVGKRPELALITCYPFDYVGPAPKRFVVHAHLLSVSPQAPAL